MWNWPRPKIPKPVDFDYIWGDALEILAHRAPDASIINLETALTRSDDAWPGKGIHYRMHPENIPCLTTAPIDCCVLANNHVLDWGYQGLAETLKTLRQAGLKTAGAGLDRQVAAAPAILEKAGKGPLIVLAFGHPSSGIPLSWAAQSERPGVNLLEQLSSQTVQRIAEQIQAVKGANAIVVVSIHWGGNWGYHVPDEQRRFAHRLIDEAGVHVIHGHSSHHPRGIEVYRGKPILYGCGDFLNDYEGIQGHERFRGDLTLMYFPTLDSVSGRLIRFTMAPMQIRRFRLQRASAEDARRLHNILDRESRRFGCRVALNEDFTLTLRWTA
jgi:poly-gamma-glutamate capsule biosynthesis protein CapA/YwtB (metallophosphatase superfamily)